MISIPGVPPRLDGEIAGCPFRPRCDVPLDRCGDEHPELRLVEGRPPGRLPPQRPGGGGVVSGNEKAAAPATASAAGMTGPQPPLLEVAGLTTHYQVRRG